MIDCTLEYIQGILHPEENIAPFLAENELQELIRKTFYSALILLNTCGTVFSQVAITELSIDDAYYSILKESI